MAWVRANCRHRSASARLLGHGGGRHTRGNGWAHVVVEADHVIAPAVPNVRAVVTHCDMEATAFAEMLRVNRPLEGRCRAVGPAERHRWRPAALAEESEVPCDVPVVRVGSGTLERDHLPDLEALARL